MAATDRVSANGYAESSSPPTAAMDEPLAGGSETSCQLPRHLKVCELFAGIGGWRVALETALPQGVTTEFSAYDSGPHCSEVYARNFGEQCSRRNIEQLSCNDLDGFDIWVMSPPCQPFSTTREAKQRDIKDKRCAALEHLCGILPRLPNPPRWIALENVKGFYGSEACKKWREALLKTGFSDRQIILDLISFGTPNHRTRYYLLAERKVSSEGREPALASKAMIPQHNPELLPPGVLAKGPWAQERRRELEEAHAAARLAPDRETREDVFLQARRKFSMDLQQLHQVSGSTTDSLATPDCSEDQSHVMLVGTSSWKLLPLPRAEPDTVLLIFDEGEHGSNGYSRRFLEDMNAAEKSSCSPSIAQVTWTLSNLSTQAGGGSVADANMKSVGDFLDGSLSAHARSELLLSLDVLSRPFAPGLSYVRPADKRTFCFTGHYGKVMHKASGSLLHDARPYDGSKQLDKANPASAHGAIRHFSPKEILNFLGFPAHFSLPPDMERKHSYKVVGNSIAVTVAADLLRFLLLGIGGERLAQLEQPPPDSKQNEGE
eukprot:TRINITY_DN42898_c0_g1_i1.p1 TRINITY_DN42898_c0_g1~~TRINITY_DN42898_c0_g1_i1.p1  ORF type:complete len:560 (+),score=61.17 TRINITY_DN42898_c0_g1_i1:37-1680(+)